MCYIDNLSIVLHQHGRSVNCFVSGILWSKLLLEQFASFLKEAFMQVLVLGMQTGAPHETSLDLASAEALPPLSSSRFF